MYHFIIMSICDFHFEWSNRATALPCTTARLFFCLVNFLTQWVKNFILILSFEASHDFEHLYFLFHQKLIYLWQIFKTPRNYLKIIRYYHIISLQSITLVESFKDIIILILPDCCIGGGPWGDGAPYGCGCEMMLTKKETQY